MINISDISEDNYSIEYQVSNQFNCDSILSEFLGQDLFNKRINVQERYLDQYKIHNQNIMNDQESSNQSKDSSFFEELSMKAVMSGSTDEDDKVEPIQFGELRQNDIQQRESIIEAPLRTTNVSQNTEVQIKTREDVFLMLKSSRKHLKRQRKRRGSKTALQQRVDGYFTKNFLQYGKKPHLDFLIKMGKSSKINYFVKYTGLKLIQDKAGITLGDYLYMYSIVELEEVWKLFFKRKILYSAMMISRALTDSRLIISNFLYRFQEAFKTRNFDHIA